MQLQLSSIDYLKISVSSPNKLIISTQNSNFSHQSLILGIFKRQKSYLLARIFCRPRPLGPKYPRWYRRTFSAAQQAIKWQYVANTLDQNRKTKIKLIFKKNSKPHNTQKHLTPLLNDRTVRFQTINNALLDHFAVNQFLF